MITSPTVYVLHWKYFDGSGCGISGVFDDKDMAEALYDFAVIHADSKNFYLDTFNINDVKPQEIKA